MRIVIEITTTHGLRSATDVEDAVARSVRTSSDTAPLALGDGGPILDRYGTPVGRWEVKP